MYLRLILFCSFCLVGQVFGQLSYTTKKFKDFVLSNVVYGVDTTFDGSIDTLKLDLYKPVGDSNCRRPIAIVVHGGAWLAGDKAGGALPTICRELTARGYVVASINYRMGMHPASYYVPYALCTQEKCSYSADTAEWIRAQYRAAQDLKSAIRFMKQRNYADSTDHNNVYLVGESAGAFTINAAAWLDREIEKPVQCSLIADAPIPDDDLKSCIITNGSRKRPDLGSIHGKGNLGSYNARVKGVASFYGGVLDTSIFVQQNNNDTPVLYLYHQTCDIVIDNNIGRVFWKLYNYCYNPINLCMPMSGVPMSFGSSAINSYIASMLGVKPSVKFTLLTSGGAYNCSPSSNCHGIDNIPIRLKEVTDFFALQIQKSGNIPSTMNCYFSIPNEIFNAFKVYPNPVKNTLNLSYMGPFSDQKITYTLTGMEGKIADRGWFTANSPIVQIAIPQHLSNGVYILNINQNKSNQCLKVVLDKD